ncbi:AAA family ATPase [Vulgatibacter sp.]|uniref:AAA family ATPase n=1 Tax=Vulgatibacter sp. TaxID=1971226 RepID=UPI003565331A
MPETREIQQILAQAEDIAASVGQPLTTAHLLLALFTTPCAAGALLAERGIGDREIVTGLTRTPDEPAAKVEEALLRAREIAAGVGAPTDSLHLLIAFGRQRGTLAYDLLVKAGLPLAALRNTVLSWYTGGRRPKGMEPVGGLAVEAALAPTRTEPPRPRAATARRTPIDRAAQPAEPPAPRMAPPPATPAAPGLTAARPSATPPAAPPPASTPRAAAPIAPPPEPIARAAAPAPAAKPDPVARIHAAATPRRFSTAELALDPAVFPQLATFGRNLTEAAAQGRLDPVIGREREVDEVVDILGKRRGNNPVLVGDPGVGKTAVVEGVAQQLLAATRTGVAPRLLVELEMGGLVAGTSLRGSFSERLGAIKEEVRAAGGRVVVFLDELHTVVGAGSSGDGPQDAANELKTALARGEFPCIGATTWDEYRKYVESDPALERRFTPVRVDEPTLAQTVEILRGLAPRYARHHGVAYDDEALQAAAQLSARYIPDRQLPDKAIGLLDLAGSRTARAGGDRVDVRAIAAVVSRIAAVPLDRLLLDDREKLLRLEADLGGRVMGHRETIAKVAAAIRRNYAGFGARRPMGSFLFLGPTGVGKTELAKAIAEVLHGSEGALVRVDMSELGESHSVARLIGAPPGYVGHGEGGQLTEAVRRRPASVVLFDEIEKAHRDVLLLLLQVLDEGRLTDARGKAIDFTQSIVILTSNLGAEAFTERSAPRMGFGAAAQDEGAKGSRALEAARAQLPPELWNRIDDRCLFEPLRRDEVAQIARLLLADSAKRIAAERRIAVHFDDAVIERLLDRGGWDPTLGARPMRQAIQREIEAPLAEAILRGAIADGAAVHATVQGDDLAFRV